MNIVSTSNRWLNHLYKTVAIILVLLAVAISAFRLFLPYVHHYQLPLQNYLNEKAQTNMSFGSLSMTWQDYGPSLVMADVKILDTENASVFIQQLELQVDFWKTITQQDLISKNLILTGAKVDIDQQLWKFKEVDKTSTVIPTDTEVNDVSVISDLFLNKIKRFSILDGHITVRNGSITRSIRVNKLHWLNTDERHQAQGSVVLNGLSSNNLQLKLDLNGEGSTNLNGQVYLQANHIDITPWLDNVLVLEDDKTKTDINFSAWLNVESSNLKQLKINFSDSDMNWFFNDKKQKLTLEKGQLLLVKGKKERSFTLYSTPLSLKLNNDSPQNFTARLAKKSDDFTLHLSEIDVGMLAQLAPLIVGKEETRKLLQKMTLSGKVENLYLRQEDNKLQAIADFSKFNNDYSHGIPGLENVSGQLSLVDNYLSVDFKAEQGKLDFDKSFVQAFPYESLSGQLNVAFNNKGWALTVEKVDFLSKEINLSAQVKVEAPIDGEMNLALLANISNGNAGLVGRYLPLPIMSENLVSYLNAAVVSGRVEDAQVLINGPITRFPFTDGSGIFVVDVELSQAEFKFVENWPSITDFVANLNFTNNSMLITGRSGQLTGLDITGVTAAIADLAHGQILTVDAVILPTLASNISDLMNASPLRDSVGSTLKHLQIGGEVSGDFHLNLPLNNNKQSIASGNILFNNNTAFLKTPQMNFSKVQGQLSFSNDEINTKGLQLNWQGLPIALDITASNRTDYYNTDIKLKALWKESEWLPHVPQNLRKYTQGELPWQGELSLHQHHQGGFSYNANFNSDLTNTQLLLPAPYDRNIEQENSFSININGGVAKSKIVLNYGNKMHFSGQLNHQNTSFNHANLMFGKGAMILPTDGFHITTKLEYADFSLWQPLISDILDTINEPSIIEEQQKPTPLLAKPKRIRGSIGQLEIFGQKLNNVSFNLLDKSQWWLLQLNAIETRSQIKIYPDWLAQGLDINAEFLKLPQDKKEAEVNNTPLTGKTGDQSIKKIDQIKNDIIFSNFPPMNFHCDSCSIGLLDLGKVDFNINRVDQQTIEFNDFIADKNQTKLYLTGIWTHNAQTSTTSLKGNLIVDDIETELKVMGYDSIIKDSGAEVDANLSWLGGLHDFSVNQVSGNVQARLDDGYLAEVSDKARLFSVLSLQSLVRKLTLDFRDIFSDGMFYSNIQGDYQLKEGLLTTNNTEMDGTAGNLFMTGHTNLITGELDYDMSYKPELSSSLPVLAWIATLNPVTFLAGVAIDQVIRSQVVSEFNFKLSGTVDNPDFKEVDRKNKDISVDTALPLDDSKKEELKEGTTDIPKSAIKDSSTDD